jgi:hypothetical protein
MPEGSVSVLGPGSDLDDTSMIGNGMNVMATEQVVCCVGCSQGWSRRPAPYLATALGL